MAARLYRDPEYVKVFVCLKNVGDKTIYTHFGNFILETKEGNIYNPDISKTYGAGNPFTTGGLYPDSEAEGFIIFNAKDLPKILTYKDFSGNEVSQ